MKYEDKIKNAEDRMESLKKWDLEKQEKEGFSNKSSIENRKNNEKETEIERAHDMASEIERMQRRMKSKHEEFLDYMKRNNLTLMFQHGGELMFIYAINGPNTSKFKMMAYDHELKDNANIIDFIRWMENEDTIEGEDCIKLYKKLFDELRETYGHVEVKSNKLIVGNTEVCKIVDENLIYIEEKISLI